MGGRGKRREKKVIAHLSLNSELSSKLYALTSVADEYSCREIEARVEVCQEGGNGLRLRDYSWIKKCSSEQEPWCVCVCVCVRRGREE